MRKSISIVSFLFILCFYAQAQGGSSIVQDLNANKPGQGTVVIYQDDAISRLLGTKIVNTISTSVNYFAEQLSAAGTENPANTSQNFVRARGFRIQAYSGNNQRLSKNEAETRRNSIKSSFPNMDVSVTYNSPVWRVKAGHFKTREEATQALEQMKARFPSFGREMYVISDEIKIPVD